MDLALGLCCSFNRCEMDSLILRASVQGGNRFIYSLDDDICAMQVVSSLV
jgi:hypothetical protein